MKNKKVFITGATGGIGEAICNKFYQKEYNLVLTSSSDEKLLSLKKKYGENNSYYKIDISDFESIDRCMSQITTDHKDLTTIINNAGITSDNLLLRMRNDQWSKVIKTNLESNFFIVKSLLPNMISNRYGKIIGISSVVAEQGNPGQSNYVASKAGMIGFYKSIAHEVAKRNINVNVVSPGFIISPMTDKLTDIQRNKMLENIPMRKFGEPSDVASLVYFLSTNEASYITGQNFHVNGGMLMV